MWSRSSNARRAIATSSSSCIRTFRIRRKQQPRATRSRSEHRFEARVNHNWQLLEKFEEDKIRSADQLPYLEGESLAFD